MAKLAVFGCLEKYLFTLFCFEQRRAQKFHCEPLDTLTLSDHCQIKGLPGQKSAMRLNVPVDDIIIVAVLKGQ